MSGLVNWQRYGAKLKVAGETARDRQSAQTKRSILKRTVRSPSYKVVLIDGVEREVIITSGDDLITKKINSLPDERFEAGNIVVWDGVYWIITLADLEDEIYQRGVMKRCNTYLKWQKEDGSIIGYWGYSEDVTKFAAGVVESSIINSIQFGIKITLPLNCETKKLRRGKRFLIGIEEDKPNAFKLTNRNVIISNYSQDLSGETGVLTLTLMQDQLELEKGDRPDLMIANYFEVEDNKTIDKDTSDGYRCEIVYKGSPNVRCGGSFKKFTATFYDSNDNQVEGFSPTWSITSLPEFEDKIHTQILPYEPDSIQVEVADFPAMVGSTFKITATVEIEGKSCEGELNVRVVNII